MLVLSRNHLLVGIVWSAPASPNLLHNCIQQPEYQIPLQPWQLLLQSKQWKLQSLPISTIWPWLQPFWKSSNSTTLTADLKGISKIPQPAFSAHWCEGRKGGSKNRARKNPVRKPGQKLWSLPVCFSTISCTVCPPLHRKGAKIGDLDSSTRVKQHAETQRERESSCKIQASWVPKGPWPDKHPQFLILLPKTARVILQEYPQPQDKEKLHEIGKVCHGCKRKLWPLTLSQTKQKQNHDNPSLITSIFCMRLQRKTTTTNLGRKKPNQPFYASSDENPKTEGQVITCSLISWQ